jgi:hypothetical protein
MVAENSSDEEFLRRIATAPVVVDQWQLEKLALVTQKARVLFYIPGLEPQFHSRLWGKSYPTAADAVAALAAGLRNEASVAVMPEGPYVLARSRQSDLQEVLA